MHTLPGLEDPDETLVERQVNNTSGSPDLRRRADGTLKRHIMIAYAQWLAHNPNGEIVGIFNHKNKHWTTFSISANGALKWMDSLSNSGGTPG